MCNKRSDKDQLDAQHLATMALLASACASGFMRRAVSRAVIRQCTVVVGCVGSTVITPTTAVPVAAPCGARWMGVSQGNQLKAKQLVRLKGSDAIYAVCSPLKRGDIVCVCVAVCAIPNGSHFSAGAYTDSLDTDSKARQGRRLQPAGASRCSQRCQEECSSEGF